MEVGLLKGVVFWCLWVQAQDPGQDQLPLFKALEARTPRTQKMRILILTFKNHALDEFLLDCRKHCPDADIVRIGRIFGVFFLYCTTVLPFNWILNPSMISVICRRLFCRMLKGHPTCLNPVTNPWPINCPNKGGRCENEQLKSWNLQARAKEKSKGRELAKMLRNLPEMSRRIDIRWLIS